MLLRNSLSYPVVKSTLECTQFSRYPFCKRNGTRGKKKPSSRKDQVFMHVSSKKSRASSTVSGQCFWRNWTEQSIFLLTARLSLVSLFETRSRMLRFQRLCYLWKGKAAGVHELELFHCRSPSAFYFRLTAGTSTSGRGSRPDSGCGHGEHSCLGTVSTR